MEFLGTSILVSVAAILTGLAFLVASNSRAAVEVLSLVVFKRDPIITQLLFGQLSGSHDVEHRLLVYGISLMMVGLLILLASN